MLGHFSALLIPYKCILMHEAEQVNQIFREKAQKQALVKTKIEK